MPHIIVVADSRESATQDTVMLRERITASDLESRHFAAHLLERLEWAVGDAHEAEQSVPPTDPEPEQPAGTQRSASVLITAS